MCPYEGRPRCARRASIARAGGRVRCGERGIVGVHHEHRNALEQRARVADRGAVWIRRARHDARAVTLAPRSRARRRSSRRVREKRRTRQRRWRRGRGPRRRERERHARCACVASAATPESSESVDASNMCAESRRDARAGVSDEKSGVGGGTARVVDVGDEESNGGCRLVESSAEGIRRHHVGNCARSHSSSRMAQRLTQGGRVTCRHPRSPAPCARPMCASATSARLACASARVARMLRSCQR
jgi:hypothetical protein